MHDAWLPNSARQQLRQIIKRINFQIYQCREYGFAYDNLLKLVTALNSGRFEAKKSNEQSEHDTAMQSM